LKHQSHLVHRISPINTCDIQQSLCHLNQRECGVVQFTQESTPLTRNLLQIFCHYHHFTIMANYEIKATLARLHPYCDWSEQRQATSCPFTHATCLKSMILSDFSSWSRPLTGSHKGRPNHFLSKI